MPPLKVIAYNGWTFVRGLERQINAIGEGIKASGDSFKWSNNIDEAADVALVVSGPKLPGTSLNENRTKIMRRFGDRVLVSETPLFRQGAQPINGPDPYFRLSLAGFMRDDGKFHPRDFRPYPARWEAIKKEQSLKVEPWRSTAGSYVLVCMQKPSDASLRGRCIREWTSAAIAGIGLSTRLSIRVRPHPLDPTRGLTVDLPKRCAWSKNKKLRDDLVEAHAVVTYSSLSAIESVLAGIPTFCFDPGNHAYPVSLKRELHRLSLDSEYMGHQTIDRESWLWGLAWCQWRLSELREGTPWRRLRPLLI